MADHITELSQQARMALMKGGGLRSYEDLLTLKAYIVVTELWKNMSNLSLSSRDLDEICRALKLEVYQREDHVFKQGDVGDRVFVVLLGEVDIRVSYDVEFDKGLTERRVKHISFLGPTKQFGERALQNSEPRAASVVASAYTEVISLQKDIYDSVIMNAIKSGQKVDFAPDSKEYVVRVLSQPRHNRSTEEIENVSIYLDKKIPFFQKFSYDQRKELCRVAEIISIWGKSILFRQGSIGMAFYVILSGSVDVHAVFGKLVNIGEHVVSVNPNASSSSASFTTDNLGEKVANVTVGNFFGERALESGSSLRQATIVTGDDLTELLLISREDYINFVSVMMDTETVEKLVLLRKTPIFANVDVAHLKSFAKYMQPMTFKLDDVLYRFGEKAVAIYLISKGECRAEIEVEMTVDSKANATNDFRMKGFRKKGTSTTTKEETETEVCPKEIFSLGRIAPNSVLNTVMTYCITSQDEINNQETVIASSIVYVFAIFKNDWIYNIPATTKPVIISAIAKANSKEHSQIHKMLWECTPNSFEESEWKVNKTWRHFKSNLISDKPSSPDLLKSYRTVEDLQLTENFTASTKAQDNLANSIVLHDGKYVKNQNFNSDIKVNLVMSDWGTEAALQRERKSRLSKGKEGSAAGFGSYFEGTDITSAILAQHDLLPRIKAFDDVVNVNVEKSLEFKAKAQEKRAHESKATRQSFVQQGDTAQQNLVNHPFSLVHFHREPLKLAADSGNVYKGNYTNDHDNNRRITNCFFRLCGSFFNCESTKSYLHQVVQYFTRQFNTTTIHEMPETAINFVPFNGYDNIAMVDSDLFIIFCRNSPLEYCTLNFRSNRDQTRTPNDTESVGVLKWSNILNLKYPALAKIKKQKFAIVQMKSPHVLEKKPNIQKVKQKAGAAGGLSGNDSSAAEGAINNINSSSSSSNTTTNNNGGVNLRDTKRYGLSFEPLFTSELSIVEEVVGVGQSQLDCLEYFLTHMNPTKSSVDPSKSPFSNNKTIVIFPLFEWILIRTKILNQFDIRNFFGSDKNALPSQQTIEDLNLRLTFGMDEYKAAEASSNTASQLTRDDFINCFSSTKKTTNRVGAMITPQISFQALERKIARIELSHEISEHLHFRSTSGSNHDSRKGASNSGPLDRSDSSINISMNNNNSNSNSNNNTKRKSISNSMSTSNVAFESTNSASNLATMASTSASTSNVLSNGSDKTTSTLDEGKLARLQKLASYRQELIDANFQKSDDDDEERRGGDGGRGGEDPSQSASSSSKSGRKNGFNAGQNLLSSSGPMSQRSKQQQQKEFENFSSMLLSIGSLPSLKTIAKSHSTTALLGTFNPKNHASTRRSSESKELNVEESSAFDESHKMNSVTNDKNSSMSSGSNSSSSNKIASSLKPEVNTMSLSLKLDVLTEMLRSSNV